MEGFEIGKRIISSNKLASLIGKISNRSTVNLSDRVW
jgi:hypothetical protein